MQKLAELCIRRPVFATVLVLALVVVGFFAYNQLGVDRFPKVDFPFVVITTTLPGAAPEEMETEVTDKIEEAVNTISGIDQLISTSSDGVSLVQIQFALEKDPDVAAQEVRDKINRILADLPKDSDPPIIEKLDPDADPVISIALSGPASQREISEYADRVLKRRLETVSGVGQVKLVGQRLRQINVVTDTQKLNGLGLTSADVVNALASQNVQIPGGKVTQTQRDLTLRTYGRVGTPGRVRPPAGHQPQRLPGEDRRRRPHRRRRRGRAVDRQRRRQAGRGAADPQAVGHQLDRGGRTRSRTASRSSRRSCRRAGRRRSSATSRSSSSPPSTR